MNQELTAFLKSLSRLQECNLSEADLAEFQQRLEDEYLFTFLTKVIVESEEILAIDPGKKLKEILSLAAECIVKDLKAEAATIRLFEPDSFKMYNFGAYGLRDSERVAAIPVRQSIAGRVVTEKRSIAVPNILTDPLYHNKEIIQTKGYNSLLAVPLLIPRFDRTQDDLLGSLQIYYSTKDRQFHELEIIRAEMLARRVSHVLAKKKIIELYRLNSRKEKISDQIFVTLSNRQGIKMKDIFIMLLEELGDLVQFKSCSLFSVTNDGRNIYLEAAYPMAEAYHVPGHAFTTDHHPYFRAAVHGLPDPGKHQHELVTEHYILITDPANSTLVTKGLRAFVQQHRIRCILLLPIRVNDRVRHLLTVYAGENKEYFSKDETELLTFFAKEIMKATKLEFLADTLHDFKNPAVAVAGLAARCQRLLEEEELTVNRDKLSTYMSVIAKETARLQDIAMTQTGDGREQKVDLATIARQRYTINASVIKEEKLRHITVEPPELQPELTVFCPLYGLERVIDNLLHNATKAIPPTGGSIGLRCYADKEFACLEVRNTGAIPAAKLAAVRRGESSGRGLHIIARFLTIQHGELAVDSGNGRTTFVIKLPHAN